MTCYHPTARLFQHLVACFFLFSASIAFIGVDIRIRRPVHADFSRRFHFVGVKTPNVYYQSNRGELHRSLITTSNSRETTKDSESNRDMEDAAAAGMKSQSQEAPVLIKVIGVGGAGGNAVNGMVSTATRQLMGVEFIAMNTDQQALSTSLAGRTLTLGKNSTGGLGAGGNPEVGYNAAKESLNDIAAAVDGADMVFVTAGMGGGTGTGAAPVIAAVAKELGCLTVAVVTQPFSFEGKQRARQAQVGLEELQNCADTVLVVANDRLLEIVPGRMTVEDAFLVADDILRQGVIGTSEIIVRPGLINVDFADVRSVIQNSGTALIGIGTGTGKTRAEDAAVGAICSPLLDFPIDQAQGVIFNIVGGPDMSLQEVNAAARIIQTNVDVNANIIIGALVDERCGQEVSVTVLATGLTGPISFGKGERTSVGQGQGQAAGPQGGLGPGQIPGPGQAPPPGQGSWPLPEQGKGPQRGREPGQGMGPSPPGGRGWGPAKGGVLRRLFGRGQKK